MKPTRPYCRTPEESFDARTIRSGECLIWTGSTNETYGMIWVGDREDLVHRWVWKKANGPIPAGMLVDHSCRNKLCAELSHLRLANKPQNAQNVSGPRADNTSGHLGVSWDKSRQKWIAYVSIDKRPKNLGRYDDVQEAARVAREARLAHYSHNEHDRVSDRG